MRMICAALCFSRLVFGDGLTDRVDAVFRQWSGAESPGCAMAVFKDNRIVYEHGYGMADLEHDVPIKPGTVFYVGSTSKQFTAFSALLLASQHRIELDDDIHKYIPELPDYGAPVTIREMLHHTSGLRDYNTLLALAGRRGEEAFSNRDVLDIAVRQKGLNFTPGTQFLYTNTGYVLLAVMIERVSGMPLSQFAAKNIFEPLGMTHTHIHDDLSRIVKERAMAYDANPKGGFLSDTPGVARSGAGGVLTTVGDLRAWDQNFYDTRVGGPELIQKMQENGTLTDGTRLDYAFGLFVRSLDGLRMVDHDGALGGYRAAYSRFPDQHLSVACLCNQREINAGKLAAAVAEIYLGRGVALPAPPAPAVKEKRSSGYVADLKDFAGNYFSQDLDVVYSVRSEGGKLKISIRGVPYQEWTATGPNQFAGGGSEVRFEGDRFKLTSGRVKDLLFVKVAP